MSLLRECKEFEQKEYLKLYEEQVLKWEAEEAKSDFEKQEVVKLIHMLAQLYQINKNSLEIANDASRNTIENILEMDEVELAIRVLSGDLSLQKNKKY